MENGQTVNGDFPLPWKKSSAFGITMEKKESTVKEFKPNKNEIKRLKPNEFGNKYPDYCDEYGNKLVLVRL